MHAIWLGVHRRYKHWTSSALVGVLMTGLAAAAGTAGVEEHRFAGYGSEAAATTETVRVSLTPGSGNLRTYSLASSQAQRDQAPGQRVITEAPGDPRVRSGSVLFDALFAQAVADARLNSVSEIRDGAYNNDQPIACACFQTGEKWTYVWTRDLSYAAHLGLAWFDPPRTVRSLLFKTSGFRAGVTPPASLPSDATQIVQDTGSGGSWPVSTDRVSWAWGAGAVLDTLAGPERATFARQAYAALRGTLEADREAAFDARAGVYTGEQSFLDWRTQTYAPWIVNNLSRMATSKALSTNVGHYQALRLGARLATELSQPEVAQRYARWADELKLAIHKTFWLDDVQRYASVTGPAEDPAPLYQFDMLGTALAVIAGVAPPERAAQAMAHYPHAPFGVPVITPQQPQVAVYHNRAIWPFVSAYALRAAVQVNNPVLADHAVASLMRAAALNLSNMENLEWLTGKAQHDDGPVINSRRQLWSVGAYLGMVSETVFGLHFEAQGLRISPFLTTGVRRALGTDARAVLSGVAYQGHALEVTLHLPALSDAPGYYAVRRVRLNGQTVLGALTASVLQDGVNHISVDFGALQAGDQRITQVAQVSSTSHDDAQVFAPHAPRVESLVRVGNQVRLRFSDGGNAAQTTARSYTVYRNGVAVQAGWKSLEWSEALDAPADLRQVYAVQTVFDANDHRSQHSEPVALAHEGLQVLPVDAAGVQQGWGFTVPRDGDYALELLYNNHHYDISTGVTNAVKRLRVLTPGGDEVGGAVVQMPHVEPRDGQHPMSASTPVRLRLSAGSYQLVLQDYFNMSALQSNASYNGAGGKSGALNDASILALRVSALP